MEVWEKINYLLDEKKITKQEFANRLINLAPRVKRTGETPSVQTILGYLYGKREVKIELIPYIAEVLGVTEQELFSFDIEYASEYDIRYSKEAREILNLLPYAPKNMVEHITNTLQKFKVEYDEGTKNIC
ncbi:MAG TPA: XRE family transcriptional regulator [Sulfurospirillum arcachonense]|nr:XRE family transcriptional regulator [Sulfurospirillum arcachonense]